MLENVATIVSGSATLDPSIENRAAEILKSIGIESVKIDTLDQNRAVDIYFSGNKPELHATARSKLQELGSFDIFVQANDAYRRKKILFADMDATMIEGETLDEMAAQFGLKDKVEPITIRAMRGEIDFAEALRLRVRLLAGMPEETLLKTIENIRYAAGGKTLIETLSRHGVRCVLISGGFDLFTSRVAATLGFHKNFGNRLDIQCGRLTGEVIAPIVDKHFKKRELEDEMRRSGLDLRYSAAVGDGANDIPMLQVAGAGVGYFAKPLVQAATPHQIRHSSLLALLYMQGYRRREWS